MVCLPNQTLELLIVNTFCNSVIKLIQPTNQLLTNQISPSLSDELHL